MSGRRGMTFKEIGAELGISPQYAHQICARGLAKLRRRTPYTLAYMFALSDALGTARHDRLKEK
jgi:hypothetical protein